MRGVPFYYHLNLVASTRPRQGYAAALLRPMLDMADAASVPVYVESDASDGLYTKLGFVVHASKRIQPGDGPAVSFMRREPRDPGQHTPH